MSAHRKTVLGSRRPMLRDHAVICGFTRSYSNGHNYSLSPSAYAFSLSPLVGNYDRIGITGNRSFKDVIVF